MPNLDDFYAFKNTSDGSNESGGSIFPYILILLLVLLAVGKVFS